LNYVRKEIVLIRLGNQHGFLLYLLPGGLGANVGRRLRDLVVRLSFKALMMLVLLESLLFKFVLELQQAKLGFKSGNLHLCFVCFDHCLGLFAGSLSLVHLRRSTCSSLGLRHFVPVLWVGQQEQAARKEFPRMACAFRSLF
jgi:hypothetical protein